MIKKQTEKKRIEEEEQKAILGKHAGSLSTVWLDLFGCSIFLDDI